jgi:hypothetical protein
MSGQGVVHISTINQGGVENVVFAARTENVKFGVPGATLNLENPTSLVGSISGMQVGDVIDFLNTNVDQRPRAGQSFDGDFRRKRRGGAL